MRILLMLALLCTSLTACTVFAQPAIRPPQADVEMLYRALAFQEMTYNSFLNAAAAIKENKMSGEQAMAFTLGTIGLMRESARLLDREFPKSLTTHADIARAQHDALRGIGKRWIDDGTLQTADVVKELDVIHPTSALRKYAVTLVELGWTNAEIEKMRLQLADDVAKTFGIKP